MTTVSLLTHPPFVIVHRKEFAPAPKALTPDTGLAELEIVPVPDSTDQLPVPGEGLFPAKVADAEQTD